MTIKMPEPAKIEKERTTENGKWVVKTHIYYTADALRDVLEQAAKEFKHFGGFKDGYSCAERLRELQDSIK